MTGAPKLLTLSRSVENGFFISGNFVDDDLDERDALSDREEEAAAREETSRRPGERERTEEFARSPLAAYTAELIRNAKAESSMREAERRKRALVRRGREAHGPEPRAASAEKAHLCRS